MGSQRQIFEKIAELLAQIRSNDPESWQFEPGVLKELSESVNKTGWFHSQMEDIDAVLMVLSEFKPK